MRWIVVAFVLAFGPATPSPGDRAESIRQMNRGLARIESGDLPAAEAFLDAAVMTDPKYPRARLARALLLRRLERHEEAAAELEAALALPQSEPTVEARIEMELGQHLASYRAGMSHTERIAADRRAIELFSRAIEADPNDVRAYRWRAGAHERLDDPQAADRDLRHCIELRPDFAPCFVDLALVYFDRGHEREALAVLAEGVRINPNDADMWRGSGRLHLMRGWPVDAIDSLEKSMAIEPEVAETHYLLGMACAEILDRQAAVEHLERFLELADPDDLDGTARRHAAQNTIARMQDII